MSAANLDPHLLATLDPEERAAFEPDPEADADALRAVAAGANDDDNDDDDDDEAEGNGGAPIEGKGAKDTEPAPAPAAAPAPAQPAQPADAGDEVPAPRAPAPKSYEAKLPSDYEAQLQSIKDEDAALRQRFKDGEIDIDERDAGLAALTEKREGLLVARTKAEIAGEMSQQSTAAQWNTAVNTFLDSTAKNQGIDYRKDEALGKALDDAVKMLANNPANDDKSMDWFLTQAHKWVVFDRGLTAAPAPAPAPADPKKTANEKRKPDTSTIPRSLADVPGADGPGDVSGEFDHLDTLDGEAYETAIARMTPAQREKFLRGD